MKVCNSLKTAKLREKGCKIVRRRGRVYVSHNQPTLQGPSGLRRSRDRAASAPGPDVWGRGGGVASASFFVPVFLPALLPFFEPSLGRFGACSDLCEAPAVARRWANGGRATTGAAMR